MKSVKIAGIRLINYLDDNINWKDHKDIVLDFWISAKCKDYGYNSLQFKGMGYADDLPLEALEHYQKWFEEYDFQTEDKEWIKFIDGTLNIFYHTKDPVIMSEDTWYVTLLKSELKAREICEEQIFHGDPNLNSFWKLDTNTKSEEVGGRRNGYLFSTELDSIKPKDTKGYYWAIAYQCPPDTVKLTYKDGKEFRAKCINWAADCKHMTLMKITGSGRFLIQQTFVEGKAWRHDRLVPQTKTPKNPFTGSTLVKYINRNYHEMYGIWDKIDQTEKDLNRDTNARKNAVNTMNDEEIKIGKLIRDINTFINDGNVSPERRERNKKIRQSIRDKNKLREKEIKKKIREMRNEENKQTRKRRSRLNPFIDA